MRTKKVALFFSVRPLVVVLPGRAFMGMHLFNLNHFRIFLARSKLDISEEDIMGFINVVDNFKYAPM